MTRSDGDDAPDSQRQSASDESETRSPDPSIAESKRPRAKPVGASIAWDIPGDVPGASGKSRSDQAPPESPQSDPAPVPVPGLGAAEAPDVQRRRPAPAASAGQRKPPGRLLALIAAALLAGLAGLGYGYFATSTQSTADAPPARALEHSGAGPLGRNRAGRNRSGRNRSGGETAAASAGSVDRHGPTNAPATEPGPRTAAKDRAAVPHHPAGESGSTPTPHFITYMVKKGDTLWDISKKYLHDPFRYPELAQSSHIQDPHWIYPGDIVRIPAGRANTGRPSQGHRTAVASSASRS